MIDLEKLDAAATHAQVHGYLLKWDGSEIRQLVDRIAKLEKDAGRWRMLPAFLEDHQIDYVRLVCDIDTAMESKHG